MKVIIYYIENDFYISVIHEESASLAHVQHSVDTVGILLKFLHWLISMLSQQPNYQ